MGGMLGLYILEILMSGRLLYEPQLPELSNVN